MIKKLSQSIFLLLTCLICVTSTTLLTGCNTISGFGKDLQSGGEFIEKKAKNL